MKRPLSNCFNLNKRRGFVEASRAEMIRELLHDTKIGEQLERAKELTKLKKAAAEEEAKLKAEQDKLLEELEEIRGNRRVIKRLSEGGLDNSAFSDNLNIANKKIDLIQKIEAKIEKIKELTEIKSD
ncbi:MAG: hypothetical protein V1824_03410 [archaeon]